MADTGMGVLMETYPRLLRLTCGVLTVSGSAYSPKLLSAMQTGDFVIRSLTLSVVV
jgi:hypothetical protein